MSDVKMTVKEIKSLVRVFKAVASGFYFTNKELTKLAIQTIADLRKP